MDKGGRRGPSWPPTPKITMPVADMFWGDRYGTLEDPFGHKWAVATHVRDVTEAEVAEAMRRIAAQPQPA